MSVQLYASEERFYELRKIAADQLEEQRAHYEAFVPGAAGGWDDFVHGVRNKEWGDHVTLQALADSLGRHFGLLTSCEDKPVIDVTPMGKPADTEVRVWLCFWAEVHYGAVEPSPPV